MPASSPIPPIESGLFTWLRQKPEAVSAAVVQVNKICALEVIFNGNRYGLKFSGENAVIDLGSLSTTAAWAPPAMAANTVFGNPSGAMAVPVATTNPAVTSLTATGAVSAATLVASTSVTTPLATLSASANFTATNPKITWPGDNSTLATYLAVTPVSGNISGGLLIRPSGSGTESHLILSSSSTPDTTGTQTFGFGGGFDGAITGSWNFGSYNRSSTTTDGRPISFLVQDSGGRKEALRVLITGSIRLPQYSAGVLVSDGSGNISSSNAPSVSTSFTTPKIIYTGSVIELHGTGSPEGATTAAVGSVFHRTDGGTSSTLYIKETGAGNTGWVAVSSGGGGSPGGSNTQLQYNSTGAFGGISGATSNGTNVTFGSGNLRATSPQVTTSLDDANGNELFKFTATATAVNELTLANAASGGAPEISATGSDSNITIAVTAKGTGFFKLNSSTPKIGFDIGANNINTLSFQSTSSNTETYFNVMPSGTATECAILLHGNSDPDNSGHNSFGFGGSFAGAVAGSWNFGSFNYASPSSDSRPISFVLSNSSVGRFETVRLLNSGQVDFKKSIASTTISTGTITVAGGAGVSGQITAGGAFKTTDTTDSSSTSTGSGIFAGGVGIAKKLFVGDATSVAGKFTATLADGNRVIEAKNSSGMLNLFGYANSIGAYMQSTDAAYTVYMPFLIDSSAIIFQISGTSAFEVSSSRLIKFTAYGAGALTTDSSGNITATSDSRAKDTIGDFNTGLAAVRLLQPKKFKWKTFTGLNVDDINVGVYAQDLISAGLPEAVLTEKTIDVTDIKNQNGFPVQIPRLDENGQRITQRIPAPLFSVSDRAVISCLINAIKELADKVDHLEAATALPVPAKPAKKL